jgi:DNA-binding IclR family transcriptional regulator
MNDAIGGKEEVSALGRGLALLKVIGMAAAPIGNRELADTTGIPKATVSRLTATLVSAGYLRQSQDSERFSLGPALLDMSSRYLRHFDLRTVARPYLGELSESAGVSVHLVVRDELDMLVIDSLRPRSVVISSRIEVGTRMTIATSAAGRAYLAALPGARAGGAAGADPAGKRRELGRHRAAPDGRPRRVRPAGLLRLVRRMEPAHPRPRLRAARPAR